MENQNAVVAELRRIEEERKTRQSVGAIFVVLGLLLAAAIFVGLPGLIDGIRNQTEATEVGQRRQIAAQRVAPATQSVSSQRR